MIRTYRERPCWRKQFKRDWKSSLGHPPTPFEPKIINLTPWVLCTCLSVVRIQFLLCKYPQFGLSLKVKRNRTTPSWTRTPWKHRARYSACTTVTTAERDTPLSSEPVDDDEGGEREASEDEGEDDESSTHGLETGATRSRQTFRSASLTISQLFVPLLIALNIKKQFGDWAVCSRSSNAWRWVLPYGRDLSQQGEEDEYNEGIIADDVGECKQCNVVQNPAMQTLIPINRYDQFFWSEHQRPLSESLLIFT